jgi:hypothetical protein
VRLGKPKKNIDRYRLILVDEVKIYVSPGIVAPHSVTIDVFRLLFLFPVLIIEDWKSF